MWLKIVKKWWVILLLFVLSAVGIGGFTNKAISNIFVGILVLDVLILLPFWLISLAVVLFNKFKHQVNKKSNHKTTAIDKKISEEVKSLKKIELSNKISTPYNDNVKTSSVDIGGVVNLITSVKTNYYETDNEVSESDELIKKRSEESKSNDVKVRAIYLKKLKKSRIFKSEMLSLILDKLNNNEVRFKLHLIEPLLTNPEKKQLNINYKGHLSKLFFDCLFDQELIRESISKYQTLLKESESELYNINRIKQIKQDDMQNIKYAKSERKDLISLEYITGEWRYVEPRLSELSPDSDEIAFDEISGCKLNHAHFHGVVFDLKSGVFDPDSGGNIFPGEVLKCQCEIDNPDY